MQKADFIIVGQGIAGSILAYLLLKKGQKVVVIDQNNKTSSSQIAAGVINPITGMRFVKSWRIDEFLPTGCSLYQEIETVLGIKLWHERSVFRVLKTVEEENNWFLRNSYPDYQPYCGDTTPSVQFNKNADFKPQFAIAEVKNGAQVNLPALVKHFRQYFKEKGILQEIHFDTNNIVFLENKALYQDIQASKIIFCEGENSRFNPYFKHLPFNPDKGELLLVHIPNLDLTQIYKNKMSIVPLHDTVGGAKDVYWVGATNAWKFDNNLPTEANKELIINELKSTINLPFEVLSHQAAIRPTVKDRRPLIGLHKVHPQLGIFNGFGTKGASLAPFWATHFVNFLLQGSLLDKEVDIKRYG